MTPNGIAAIATRIAEEEIGGPPPRCTGHKADRYNAAYNAVVKAADAFPAESKSRFWLIVHEPGRVPERKGSWPQTDAAKVLREFIAARPTAYLHVLTVDWEGKPDVEHGPEVLQMLDGRSMSVGRKHNARTLAAHTALSPQGLDAKEGETAAYAADVRWWLGIAEEKGFDSIEAALRATPSQRLDAATVEREGE